GHCWWLCRRSYCSSYPWAWLGRRDWWWNRNSHADPLQSPQGGLKSAEDRQDRILSRMRAVRMRSLLGLLLVAAPLFFAPLESSGRADDAGWIELAGANGLDAWKEPKGNWAAAQSVGL